MWIIDLFTQTFDWRFYKKYFKGQSLEEELAYANYYHFEFYNRLLHFFSFMCIYSLLTAQFNEAFGQVGHFIWYVFFFLIFSKISIPGTIIYLVLMHVCYPFLYGFIPLYLTPILFLVFQLFQLAGHLIFEKKFPAFHLFEALVITPLLVQLTILNELFPIQRELIKKVAYHTAIWKQKIESQQ